MLEGGLPKWQRTRRQTIRVNQPMSMFTSTHMHGSHMAQQLQMDSTPLVEDTSFQNGYDVTQKSPEKLCGIS